MYQSRWPGLAQIVGNTTIHRSSLYSFEENENVILTLLLSGRWVEHQLEGNVEAKEKAKAIGGGGDSNDDSDAILNDWYRSYMNRVLAESQFQVSTE